MHPAAFILSIACFATVTVCCAQSPCAGQAVGTQPGEKPVTLAQVAHQVVLTTPAEERPHLAFGDVESVLKCGTPQDAEAFFADIENRPVLMTVRTVLEASETSIRVAWDDGFNPPLGAYEFHFSPALRVIPKPGESVLIGGTYASYSREPFRIIMKNSSVAPVPPPVVVHPRSR